MPSTGLVCGVCHKTYKIRKYFDLHIQQHEEGVADGPKTVKVENVKVMFTCTYCAKEYKTQRGLDKHNLMHLQATAGYDAVPVTDDINLLVEEAPDEPEIWPESADVQEAGDGDGIIISFFEEEDEEQEALLLASIMGVPHEPSQSQPAAPASHKVSKKGTTPLALGSVCGKGLQTIEGLIKHRMAHVVEDSLLKAPSLEELNIQTGRMSSEVLQEIISSYEGGTSRLEKQVTMCSTKFSENIMSDNAKALLASLNEGLYACFAMGSKFLLPSHLREAYLRGSAILLANKEKKEELHGKLVSALNSEECENDIIFFDNIHA